MGLSRIERRIWIFLAIQLIVSILLNIVIYYVGRDQIHLLINSHYSETGDLLFPYITWLGDGITAGVVALVALLFNVRFGLIIGFSGLLSGMMSQFFKK